MAWPNTDTAHRISEIVSDDELRGELVEIALERILVLISTDCTELNARQLIEAGATDPCTINVKNELHHISKASVGRWRLIMPVSVPDQLVERFFSQYQAKTEISNWDIIPSKPGIGFNDEKVEKLYKSVQELCRISPGAASDIQGWDWSCKWRDFQAVAEARIRAANLSGTSFARGMRNSVYCLMMKVCVFSDGCALEQTKPGIQKSGSFYTSQYNSSARVMCAWRAGAPWALANGDDALEGRPERVDGDTDDAIKVEYSRQGKTVKQYEAIDSGQFEFCSQVYTVNEKNQPICYPVNYVRQMCKYLNGAALPEQRQQLAREWRNLPNRVTLLRMIDEVSFAAEAAKAQS